MIRVASYHVPDHDPADTGGWERTAAVIAGLDADVVALQNIGGPYPDEVVERMRWLGEATGLNVWVREPYQDEDLYNLGEPAVEPGGHGVGVGLLWRGDRVELVPGSLRTATGPELWHGLIAGMFDVTTATATARIGCGSYQAPPVGRARRRDEAEQLVAFTAAPPLVGVPLLLGGGWNTLGADRLADGSLYAPDPYAARPWTEDLVHQCVWDYDEDGRRARWRADREPGDVLFSGGLRDAAAVLADRDPAAVSSPFASIGDTIRMTAGVAAAVRAHGVIDTEATRAAGTHLPVVVDCEETALAGGLSVVSR